MSIQVYDGSGHPFSIQVELDRIDRMLKEEQPPTTECKACGGIGIINNGSPKSLGNSECPRCAGTGNAVLVGKRGMKKLTIDWTRKRVRDGGA